MNKLLTVLFVAALTSPVLAAPAPASPGFYEEAMMIARNSAVQERDEMRDQRKARQELKQQKRDQAEQEQEERRYGYGYERRNPERLERPERNYDSRGRR